MSARETAITAAMRTFDREHEAARALCPGDYSVDGRFERRRAYQRAVKKRDAEMARIDRDHPEGATDG